MKKNVGIADRIIRAVIAMFIVYFISITAITGGWAIALSITGGVLLLTAFSGNCPVYSMLGLHTCQVSKAKHGH